jgi:hypothetical protein
LAALLYDIQTLRRGVLSIDYSPQINYTLLRQILTTAYALYY